MADPTSPRTPDRADRPDGATPSGAGTRPHTVVLTLLLVVVAVWAIWTSVSLLGYAVDTCLANTGQDAGAVAPGPEMSQVPDLTPAPSTSSGQEAAAAAALNTNECMAGDVTLWPTSITFADAPFDLLLVRLPWIGVMLVLWLIYRERSVSEGTAPPRTIDVFSAGGWIGPAAIGSLVMFIIGTVLLIPRLL